MNGILISKLVDGILCIINSAMRSDANMHHSKLLDYKFHVKFDIFGTYNLCAIHKHSFVGIS